ncbi:hypothetical protein ACFYZH_03845 [Streptomyces abikoensis]|uniref:hypothetical protein n=1 Tax=Streptomyces abikoensis TaxID=97398 RepID=UPI0036B39847
MPAAELGGGVAQGFDHLVHRGDLADADADDSGRPGGLRTAGDAVQVGQRQGTEGVTARRGEEVPAVHVAPPQLDD